MTYAQKLKDPRWQRKRLEVLNRENFRCEVCDGDTKTLHVHHSYYETGRQPWDYPLETLHCVCEDCHTEANELRVDIQRRAAGLSIRLQFMVSRILCWLSMIESAEQAVHGDYYREKYLVFDKACTLAQSVAEGDRVPYLEGLAYEIRGLHSQERESLIKVLFRTEVTPVTSPRNDLVIYKTDISVQETFICGHGTHGRTTCRTA